MNEKTLCNMKSRIWNKIRDFVEDVVLPCLTLLFFFGVIYAPIGGTLWLYEYFRSPAINKVIRTQQDVFQYTDTTGACPTLDEGRYTIFGPAGYEPTRHDSCANCHEIYRKHQHIPTKKERDRSEFYFEPYAFCPRN